MAKRREENPEQVRQQLSAAQQPDEFEAFRELTKNLLSVPKSELDAKLRETKDQG